MYEHWTVFSVHTQNGKLADREEIFTEFDRKCIWLESQTTPLKLDLKIAYIINNNLNVTELTDDLQSKDSTLELKM